MKFTAYEWCSREGVSFQSFLSARPFLLYSIDRFRRLHKMCSFCNCETRMHSNDFSLEYVLLFPHSLHILFVYTQLYPG